MKTSLGAPFADGSTLRYTSDGRTKTRLIVKEIEAFRTHVEGSSTSFQAWQRQDGVKSRGSPSWKSSPRSLRYRTAL